MGCLFSSNSYHGLDQVDLGPECRPSSQETAAHAEFQQEVMSRAPENLRIIDEYQGCQDMVKVSMAENASYEEKQQAFYALEAAVQSISMLWGFSNTLSEQLQTLLINISQQCSRGDDVVNLTDAPGLTNQLAYILQYALVFDHTRMQRFVLQNDFSFFRRMKGTKEFKNEGSLSEDDTNNMSNFVQEHIPMIKSTSKGADLAYQKDSTSVDVLATLANTVLNMLKKNKVSDNLRNYAATVMTGAALTFDRVHPAGVFHKQSPVDIKNIITLLQKEFSDLPQLIGALHFSTKTFRSAPDKIQEMFE